MTQTLAPLTLPAPDEFADWLDTRNAEGLEAARAAVRRLKGGEATSAAEALAIWDQGMLGLANAASCGALFSEVHPDEEVRTRGETAVQEVQKLDTELRLDRELYDVFAALDPTELDPQAARLLDKTLTDFRRAGVDRDDETRARITEINEQLTVVGQEFSKNIRDDKTALRFPPERLGGLPQDWLDAHPVDDEGLVTVTTDYPDVIPVRTFCTDGDVRRQMTAAFLNQGWPAERRAAQGALRAARGAGPAGRLRHLGRLRRRREDDRQGSGDPGVHRPDHRGRRRVRAARPRGTAGPAARRRPTATTIDTADMPYFEELVRKEQYDVDAQVVRTYFDFSRVRAGLLEVTARLFDLTYTPVDDAVVWHPDVTAYDVTLAGAELGRIYLDLHPRDNKYSHAAQFTLTDGVVGQQLPRACWCATSPRG